MTVKRIQSRPYYGLPSEDKAEKLIKALKETFYTSEHAQKLYSFKHCIADDKSCGWIDIYIDLDLMIKEKTIYCVDSTGMYDFTFKYNDDYVPSQYLGNYTLYYWFQYGILDINFADCDCPEEKNSLDLDKDKFIMVNDMFITDSIELAKRYEYYRGEHIKPFEDIIEESQEKIKMNLDFFTSYIKSEEIKRDLNSKN